MYKKFDLTLDPNDYDKTHPELISTISLLLNCLLLKYEYINHQ